MRTSAAALYRVTRVKGPTVPPPTHPNGEMLSAKPLQPILQQHSQPKKSLGETHIKPNSSNIVPKSFMRSSFPTTVRRPSAVSSNRPKRHITDTETSIPLPTTYSSSTLPLATKSNSGHPQLYQITLHRSVLGLPIKTRTCLNSLGLFNRHEVVWRRICPEAAGLILKVKELVALKTVDEVPPKHPIPLGYRRVILNFGSPKGGAILFFHNKKYEMALGLPPNFSLILGSSSQSRALVLNQAQIPFKVLVANIDEDSIGDRSPGASPSQLVLTLARAKADAILSRGISTPSILVCCDQVAVCKGEIREKPKTAMEARQYLQSYSKWPAETFGGIVVVNTVTGKRTEQVDVARQYFLPIPDHVIDELIAKGGVFKCCGGFTIEDPLLQPYLGTRDGEADSILGLPLKALRTMIAAVVQ